MAEPSDTEAPGACTHLSAIREVKPSSPWGCTNCLAKGDQWVNLRICLTCGQVGCCDNSPNRHATAHFHETGHPIIQSYQPGEGWRWCYADSLPLPDATPFRQVLDLPVIRIDRGEVGGFFVRNPDGGDDPEFLAELTYYWRGRLMVITHTTVREQIKHRGYSRKLHEAAVAAARAEGFKILPQCPHLLRNFNKTPEWDDVRHRY